MLRPRCKKGNVFKSLQGRSFLRQQNSVTQYLIESSNDRNAVKQLKKQRAVSRKKSKRTRTISAYLKKGRKIGAVTDR